MFEKYGGEQTIWAFVEILIEKLVTNRLTKQRFCGKNLEPFKRTMYYYF